MGFPNIPNLPPPPGSWAPSDPGFIPLRPLMLGDLVRGGFGIVRRHLALLGPLAVLIAAASSAVDLLVLAGSGALSTVASGQWIDDLSTALSTGRAAVLPTGLYLATSASTLVSVVGALALAAVATAAAGADAVSRTGGRAAALARLRGRGGALALVALVVGLAVMVGSFLIVIPGVIAYTAWALAGSAAVMEGARPGRALARSARLTRGHRWRILGVTVVILVLTTVIESVISSIVVRLIPDLSVTASLVVSDIVTTLVSAVTTSWTCAVIALLYIDIRIRTENLGAALRAHAAGPGTA